jgi:hypothetical protein
LFFWIFLICPFPPCVFEISWFIRYENLSMGTWERKNIAVSSPTA